MVNARSGWFDRSGDPADPADNKKPRQTARALDRVTPLSLGLSHASWGHKVRPITASERGKSGDKTRPLPKLNIEAVY
jgi:hypothetical protein